MKRNRFLSINVHFIEITNKKMYCKRIGNHKFVPTFV